MKQTKFWLIMVIITLVSTWAVLVIKITEEQGDINRIENHSEIMTIDTAE